MKKQEASLNARYARQKNGVLTREVSNEIVIVDIKRGIYHGLNAVGVQIWEQLDGQRMLSQIVDELADYHADVEKARIETDTLSLVQVLLDNELVVAH